MRHTRSSHAATCAAALVILVAACGPKAVVFTPAACEAEPCDDALALVGDSTNPRPDYPEIMRNVGIDGRVEAEFVVMTDGTVDPDSVVIRSSTNKAFERNTMLAIDRWRFATRDGRVPPRPTRYAVVVEFRLIQDPPATSEAASKPASHEWRMTGGSPVLVVVARQPYLVPRSQVRPRAVKE